MYVMETYLDDDRLPVIEKTKICEEKVTLNSPELIFNFLNKFISELVSGWSNKSSISFNLFSLATSLSCIFLSIQKTSFSTKDYT